MPKDKESLYIFRQRMIRMFPGIFRADQFCLFCLLCHKPVMGKKVFNVKQHLATAKHKLAAEILKKDEKRLLSYESDSDLSNNVRQPSIRNESIIEEAQNCNDSQSSALLEKEMKVNFISSSASNNNDVDTEPSEMKLQPFLELEYLQMRNYKMKLEILILEQKLRLPPSKFTSNLKAFVTK